jgi:hypothetical protein
LAPGRSHETEARRPVSGGTYRRRQRSSAAESDPTAIGGPIFLRCEVHHSITSSARASSVAGTSERLGGFQVDDELEPGRLHDRQIGGLGALEGTAGIGASLDALSHASAFRAGCLLAGALGRTKTKRAPAGAGALSCSGAKTATYSLSQEELPSRRNSERIRGSGSVLSLWPVT